MAQAPMIPIDATTIVMIPPTSSRAANDTVSLPVMTS